MEDYLNYTKLKRFPPFQAVGTGRGKDALPAVSPFIHRYPEGFAGGGSGYRNKIIGMNQLRC